MDFYINITPQQWTGRVEKVHIIFSHDDWGRGQPDEHRAQGGAAINRIPYVGPKCLSHS